MNGSGVAYALIGIAMYLIAMSAVGKWLALCGKRAPIVNPAGGAPEAQAARVRSHVPTWQMSADLSG